MNTSRFPEDGDLEESLRGRRGPRGPRRGHSRSGGPSPKGERPSGPRRKSPDESDPRVERLRRMRGGRGRAPRGDVRAATLTLLAEEPMHGYQLMQAIADRSNGRWTPSPGAIYPTLNQLEDEGLVTITRESGRKLATLTEAGA
ncbi:MAG: PadR family transcriptional regulator, partial [Actinomycetia bacterium]|nr:PadR family transcriptional regulator [Actinomycetes bacterium]